MSTRNTSYSSYNAEATRPSSATDSDTTTLFGTDCWQKQVLPTPYINRKRLLAKLRSRYGENGFRVQLRLNEYTVFAPDVLDERDIRDICRG